MTPHTYTLLFYLEIKIHKKLQNYYRGTQCTQNLASPNDNILRSILWKPENWNWHNMIT